MEYEMDDLKEATRRLCSENEEKSNSVEKFRIEEHDLIWRRVNAILDISAVDDRSLREKERKANKAEGCKASDSRIQIWQKKYTYSVLQKPSPKSLAKMDLALLRKASRTNRKDFLVLLELGLRYANLNRMDFAESYLSNGLKIWKDSKIKKATPQVSEEKRNTKNEQVEVDDDSPSVKLSRKSQRAYVTICTHALFEVLIKQALSHNSSILSKDSFFGSAANYCLLWLKLRCHDYIALEELMSTILVLQKILIPFSPEEEVVIRESGSLGPLLDLQHDILERLMALSQNSQDICDSWRKALGAYFTRTYQHSKAAQIFSEAQPRTNLKTHWLKENPICAPFDHNFDHDDDVLEHLDAKRRERDFRNRLSLAVNDADRSRIESSHKRSEEIRQSRQNVLAHSITLDDNLPHNCTDCTLAAAGHHCQFANQKGMLEAEAQSRLDRLQHALPQKGRENTTKEIQLYVFPPLKLPSLMIEEQKDMTPISLAR